jgi:DNA-binding NarL/FixJ family response regulator
VAPQVRVFHCDDSSAFRLLVREMLAEYDGVSVVGEAGTMEQALERLPEMQADVVLVDLFEGWTGADLVAPLREAAPGAEVLIYTGMPETHVPGSARHVHKSVAFDELHRIITEVAART